MKKENLLRRFPEMTEADYLEQVQGWLAITDMDKSKEHYEAEILPRSCYRVLSQASEQIVPLMFVPVGTQPYAPLIACLANPAEKTVLLTTKKSLPHAQWLDENFPGRRSFHKISVDEFDAGDIVRKVLSAYDVMGQPNEVLCDVTGGTKIMTATLAGIAAINGWRQTYVSSEFGKAGSHSERVIPVANVFDHLGGWHRVAAWKLASVGQFAAAAASLKIAAEQSVASAQDRRDLKRFALAQAYRDGKAAKVLSAALKVGRTFQTDFPPVTIEAMQSEDLRGFHYWVANCLAAEGQKLAAVAILGRLGIAAEPESVSQTLKELGRAHGSEWNLKAWKPLDNFVGRGYSSGVTCLG